MSEDKNQVDVWNPLRAHTSARIGLGRIGVSMPTAEVLRFSLAHARAKDAVHAPLDADKLISQLHEEDYLATSVASKAADRASYLLRPDLGRELDEKYVAPLREMVDATKAVDVAVVLADGLSAIAVERHAIELLDRFRVMFKTDWSCVPIVVATQSRVALGDDVANALRAKLVIVMIGERPGLSSPDSLGIYVTFAPRKGQADSGRNCISNVRPQGLGYDEAVVKLHWLVQQSIRLQMTGVDLKDNSDVVALGKP